MALVVEMGVGNSGGNGGDNRFAYAPPVYALVPLNAFSTAKWTAAKTER